MLFFLGMSLETFRNVFLLNRVGLGYFGKLVLCHSLIWPEHLRTTCAGSSRSAVLAFVSTAQHSADAAQITNSFFEFL